MSPDYDFLSGRRRLVHKVSKAYAEADAELKDTQNLLRNLRQALLELKKPETDEARREVLERFIRETTETLEIKFHRIAHLSAQVRNAALKDGAHKTITHEGMTDRIFSMLRAYETVAGGLPAEAEPLAVAQRFLKETQGGLREGAVPGELRFGVMALDLNQTGANGVDFEFGDLVLKTTLDLLKERFGEERATQGNKRTNFRVILEDPSKLSSQTLKELEDVIMGRLFVQIRNTRPVRTDWLKKLNGNGNKPYRLNLVAGYAEGGIPTSVIERRPSGEYAPAVYEQVAEALDRTWVLAQARSNRAYETIRFVPDDQYLSVDRLYEGEVAPSELQSIPEGSWYEGEAHQLASRAPRPIHDFKQVQRLLMNLVDWSEKIQNQPQSGVEGEAPRASPVEGATRAPVIETGMTPELVQAQLVKAKEVQSLLGKAYYDATHDARYNRLVELEYLPERVDALIRQTGSAHLLFVELGQFNGFVRGWSGGHRDVFVHELIYNIYKELAKEGLLLVHPESGEVFDPSKEVFLVDPHRGEPFKDPATGSPMADPQTLSLQRDALSGRPLAPELVLGGKAGDELGFITAGIDRHGMPVTDARIKTVLGRIGALIRGRYSSMYFNEAVKVGVRQDRTPLWESFEWNGKKGAMVPVGKERIAPEQAVVQDFSGWLVTYEGVLDPATQITQSRRACWTLYNKGQPVDGRVYYSDEIGLPPKDLPADKLQLPRLVQKQTTLSAGVVATRLRRSSDFSWAWFQANLLSKKSKERGGEPLLFEIPDAERAVNNGNHYEPAAKNLERTHFLLAHFGRKTLPEPVMFGTGAHDEIQPPVFRLLERLVPRSMGLLAGSTPHVFYQELLKQAEKDYGGDPAKLEGIRNLVRDSEGGQRNFLTEIVDGLYAAAVVRSEIAALDVRDLAVSLFSSLSRAQDLLPKRSANGVFVEAKRSLLRAYIRETGEVPESIVNGALSRAKPGQIWLTDDLKQIGRELKISPDRIPYLLAGPAGEKLKAAAQKKVQGLSPEIILKWAEQDLAKPKEASDPAERSWLKNHRWLLRDTLKSRMAMGGVPFAAGILSILPAEKICDLMGLDPHKDRELRFVAIAYLTHTVNLPIQGAYEVAFNRYVAKAPFDFRVVERGAVEGLHFERNILVPRMSSFAKAAWMNMLTKMEIIQPVNPLQPAAAEKAAVGAADAVAFKGSFRLARGIGQVARLPVTMAWRMGPGLMASAITDRALGTVLPPDSRLRFWLSTGAMFAPDLAVLLFGQKPWMGAMSRRLRIPSRLFAVGFMADLGYLGVAKLAYGKDFSYELSVNQRASALKDSYLTFPFRLVSPNLGAWVDSHGLFSTEPNEYFKAVVAQDEKMSSETQNQLAQMVRSFLVQGNPLEAELPGFYSQVSFEEFRRPVLLGPFEKRVLQFLQINGKRLESMGEVDRLDELTRHFRSDFDFSEKALRGALRKISLFQMQENFKVLAQMDLPKNDPLRNMMDSQGLLQPLGEKAFVEWLEGQGVDSKTILHERKIAFVLRLMTPVPGKSSDYLWALGKEVGILNAKGEWADTALVKEAEGRLTELYRSHPEAQAMAFAQWLDSPGKIQKSFYQSILFGLGQIDSQGNPIAGETYYQGLKVWASRYQDGLGAPQKEPLLSWIADRQTRFLITDSAMERQAVSRELAAIGMPVSQELPGADSPAGPNPNFIFDPRLQDFSPLSPSKKG